jgi:hypothetical protein
MIGSLENNQLLNSRLRESNSLNKIITETKNNTSNAMELSERRISTRQKLSQSIKSSHPRQALERKISSDQNHPFKERDHLKGDKWGA